jgi:O-antigen ligase
MALLAAAIAVMWIGLVPTFSQSSFAALLAGLAVLAALRWSLRWTLAAVAAGAVLAIAVVIFAGGVSKLSPDRFNVDTGGRANLVSGGTDLFAQRPLWGYGAGSFPAAYREHAATRKVPVSVSHTQPVTVAAEQGLIGLLAYVALIACALWAMTVGLMGNQTVGRAAVLAAFVALLVHTLAYAGFFEDPISWVLLAIGAALAAFPVRDAT